MSELQSLFKLSKKKQKQDNRFLWNETKIAENGLRKIKKVGVKTLYLCSKCNTTFLCKRKNLTKNPVCRNCMSGASFGEDITARILVENKVRFEKEKTFRGLKGQGGGRLRFDYYIFNPHGDDFVIEIDGDQHQGGEWSPNTVVNDKIKDAFCRNKKVDLHRINYKFGKLQRLANEVAKLLLNKGFNVNSISIDSTKSTKQVKYMEPPVIENIQMEQLLSTTEENVVEISSPADQVLEEVSLFVRGYCNTINSDRPGMFVAMLTKGSYQKIIDGTNKNTTTNRMIISGVIEAVKLLKRPCRINLFTQTLIGLKCKGLNKDLIHDLLYLINSNHHALIETVTQERQKELQKILSSRLKTTQI